MLRRASAWACAGWYGNDALTRDKMLEKNRFIAGKKTQNIREKSGIFPRDVLRRRVRTADV